ncbi:InlB B-repeat-containing protein [Anaerostipes caccae]|uniref:InlB B-repeat-containing protein n=1 Tax=Anaerostipes caccae TaxID=105841 RepID=UPI0038D3B1EC
MKETPVSTKKSGQKAGAKAKKTAGLRKKLAKNGQTLLDISQGDIRITLNGATGGGLPEDETVLNPKGYWITGTTTGNNVEVSKGVKTDITLDNVSITVGKANDTASNWDCIDVSHADVTITLIGENDLTCNAGRTTDGSAANVGCALAKNGMDDGSLTIQCEHVGEKGHQCDESCGSLTAKGNPKLWHAGAIGNAQRKMYVKEECGFSNFTIKGGNIQALAGLHTAGIGSACVSEVYGGGYTKDIYITGGNVKAVGTSYGSGIGSGQGNKVDGIYISGGYVEAHGGAHAPGIGASAHLTSGQSDITTNIKISGGDTIVKAIGDKTTNMPGIGSGGGNSKVSNVTAVPDFGSQGYIQDGTSETNYTFMDGTPFKQETAIEVGKFYTMVYFGPFRDTNEIEKNTKDQIGANHVISKTGGEPFGDDQLKGLTMVTGKNKDGTDFSDDELTFTDPKQIEAINRAKKKGETGEYPLTFQTPNGTQTTVTVYLKGEGTDAAQIDPEKLEPTIGADGFQQDTGGEAFREEDVRDLAQVQGKNKEGTTYPREDFTLDAGQLETINNAKTSGKGGTFELTFTSPDGKKATVEVVLKAYDETAVDETTGEQIKGVHIISRTGGDAFTKEQLKDLSDVTAFNGSGEAIERSNLIFPNEDQIKAINEAKISGKTGDFPLTIETPDGTGIMIHVYLRESGTDKVQDETDGEPKGSLGANDTTQPTGGKGFSEAEIRELCGVKGKDIHGNSVAARVDEGQFKRINEAKTKGKTGAFRLTFSLEDGTRAEVTVTLTGDHTVTFDPNGGDYQPKDQIVVGGRAAVEPKEPKKEGFMFEGWYYTDETGSEVKWDFDTPVHQSMTLKARWKKEPAGAEANGTTEKKKPENKKDTDKWKYREIGGDKEGKENRAAKTGDERHMLPTLVCTVGMAGMIVYLLRRKKIK